MLLAAGWEGWTREAVLCRMRPVVGGGSPVRKGRELVVIAGGLLGDDVADKLPERRWDADLWEEISKRQVESS